MNHLLSRCASTSLALFVLTLGFSKTVFSQQPDLTKVNTALEKLVAETLKGDPNLLSSGSSVSILELKTGYDSGGEDSIGILAKVTFKDVPWNKGKTALMSARLDLKAHRKSDENLIDPSFLVSMDTNAIGLIQHWAGFGKKKIAAHLMNSKPGEPLGLAQAQLSENFVKIQALNALGAREKNMRALFEIMKDLKTSATDAAQVARRTELQDLARTTTVTSVEKNGKLERIEINPDPNMTTKLIHSISGGVIQAQGDDLNIRKIQIRISAEKVEIDLRAGIKTAVDVYGHFFRGMFFGAANELSGGTFDKENWIIGLKQLFGWSKLVLTPEALEK